MIAIIDQRFDGKEAFHSPMVSVLSLMQKMANKYPNFEYRLMQFLPAWRVIVDRAFDGVYKLEVYAAKAADGHPNAPWALRSRRNGIIIRDWQSLGAYLGNCRDVRFLI